MNSTKKELSSQQIEELFSILKSRFLQNMNRHRRLNWENVCSKISAQPDKLFTLSEMERTGGEPDVVAFEGSSDEYVFIDCSKESPVGRRSICYDNEALEARKANKPWHSAVSLASEMGISLLSENQYIKFQQFGPFDTTTSSWIITPEPVRKLGGALFGDFRFGSTFVYHNGAESYYAARGFRGFFIV